MNDLGSPEKDAAAVDRLAKCDPVYERLKQPRKCKLCGAEGRDLHAENVRHAADCPWIYALKSRDEYGPGGRYDRTKTPEERAAVATPAPDAAPTPKG